MPDSKPIDDRNLSNRLAGLVAGQDQTRAEIEQLRGAVKSVQILLVYLIALTVIVYMVLRKGAPK